MLDVGCGFGFAVSYWNWAGGRGFGLEPSSYGRLGSELLDKNICPAYLSDAKELSERTYDRVFSSEVIEHVDDVVDFLSELTQVTSQSGMVILTTPNASFINPANDWGTVVAALSPGRHRLLFSSRALEQLLSRVGFRFVVVQESEERLTAYASRLPITLGENPDAERRSYLNYLIDTLMVREDAELRSGLLFRAFKEQINLGHVKDAAATFRQLQKEIRDFYQIDLTDIYALLRAAECVASVEEFGDHIPYFTPAVLFYAGMASLNGQRLLPHAREAFSVSMAIAEIGYRIAPDLFQEAVSLYWPAKLHIAISCISDGDHKSARECLEEIFVANLPSSTPLVALPRDVLLRARREFGIVELQTGNPESAMGIFRKLIPQAPAMREDLVALHKEAADQAKDRFRKALSS